ncbi:RNA polymerase sigma factor [Flavobacterium sp. PLA-1-15]|uniref:RNA polymerase sigma factor n=1 Tax=Flavobacterium sp. PLA-1-15 TaxID=3380533 RepID=UPI003B7F4019
MNNLDWNRIYTSTSPKLLGICRRYIKDIATAEDIIQDSFMVAIQKEDTLKDKNALNGWLSRIVINMALHHLKDAKKINFSTDQDYEIIDATTIMNTLEIDNKSLLLSSDLDRNDILEAIDKLPEHHKSVFNMYVIDQFSHNEISNALSISVGTSKSHLSRARKSIQAFLLEKIKGRPVDEKKRRRVAFLFFLGFGNQMFGNFYRNQFESFEIEPQKTFEFKPKEIQIPNHFIGLTKTVFATKIAIATISICVIGTLIYVSNFNSSTVSPKENEFIIEDKKEPETSIVPSTDSIIDKEKTVEIIQEKIISEPKKIIVKKEKIQKKSEAVVATTQIDSAKDEPKKVVVIKKQIIKKDTVYVTK